MEKEKQLSQNGSAENGMETDDQISPKKFAPEHEATGEEENTKAKDINQTVEDSKAVDTEFTIRVRIEEQIATLEGENTKAKDVNQTVGLEESQAVDTEFTTRVKSEDNTESSTAPKESSEPAGDGKVLEPSAAVSDNGTDKAGETAKNDDGDSDKDEEEMMEVDAQTPDPADTVTPRDASFTSEKFKIEISELPKKFGFAQLKKRLSVTLGLKPHKLKALPRRSYAYVCFSSEEDREKALLAINGHVWKGRPLKAKKAQPAADPMKRKLEGDSSENGSSLKKRFVDTSLPSAVRLRNSVEPLWDVPYQEQLKRKTDKAKEALRAVAYHREVKVQFMKARSENDGMCCALDPIIPSPVLEGYRNKSEFSIGRNEDDTETVVGFRFGLYKDGTDCVGAPSQISIISADSRKVIESFEKFVRQSRYPPFNHRTHDGHWRQLTVRTSREGGGTLAVAEFVVHNTKEQIEEEKESIRKYFTEGEGKEAGITSFFFRPCTSKTSNSTSVEPYQLIFGDGHIHETLGNMKFRISPSAFFQVNTAAAEVLYKTITDWCSVSPTTTVLDICCGTGTIGQFLAKNVSNVIGIEMCKEAVDDAMINAKINGVTNVTYQCAKVEHVISDIVNRLGRDCVAVVDPPRGGVHPSVIKGLRRCHGLNRIVYAACNPAGAKSNFIDLCRPKSKKTKGESFKFKRAVPIDMFPSTMHFELLVLFERDPKPEGVSTSDSD